MLIKSFLTSNAEWGKPVNIGEKLANVEAGVIGLAISSLYQKLDKMGFSSGQEFVTAMREAETAGAKLVLGDRYASAPQCLNDLQG